LTSAFSFHTIAETIKQKRMKKLLLPFVAVFLFATACEKSKLPSPAPVKSTSGSTHSASRKLVDFNYSLVKNPLTGEYSCPTPKSDCAKIVPDPLIALNTIDNAIANGSVQEFFNQDNWADLFPYLDDQPGVVAGLQNGDYTMVRKENSSKETLYIVISSDENPDSFNSAIYTTLVTKE
jgi:hypothetical protein